MAVVEDGPTLTHGGMAYGAGIVAARRFGAGLIVDPTPYAVGSIRDIVAAYPMHEPLVPAMGYGEGQVADLAATLNAMPVDVVLAATPIDLTRVLTLTKPIVRVRYELEEVSGPRSSTSSHRSWPRRRPGSRRRPPDPASRGRRSPPPREGDRRRDGVAGRTTGSPRSAGQGPTVTVRYIDGWIVQVSMTVPAVAKAWATDRPGGRSAPSGRPRGCRSRPRRSHGPTESSLVKETVVPAATDIVAGWNAYPLSATVSGGGRDRDTAADSAGAAGVPTA